MLLSKKLGAYWVRFRRAPRWISDTRSYETDNARETVVLMAHDIDEAQEIAFAGRRRRVQYEEVDLDAVGVMHLDLWKHAAACPAGHGLLEIVPDGVLLDMGMPKGFVRRDALHAFCVDCDNEHPVSDDDLSDAQILAALMGWRS